MSENTGKLPARASAFLRAITGPALLARVSSTSLSRSRGVVSLPIDARNATPGVGPTGVDSSEGGAFVPLGGAPALGKQGVSEARNPGNARTTAKIPQTGDAPIGARC